MRMSPTGRSSTAGKTGKARREEGFTLLETLLAVTLLGLVFAVGFQALSQLDRLLFRVEEGQVAAVLLQSKIASLDSGSERNSSGLGEFMGRTYRWNVVAASAPNATQVRGGGAIPLSARTLSLQVTAGDIARTSDYGMTWIWLSH